MITQNAQLQRFSLFAEQLEHERRWDQPVQYLFLWLNEYLVLCVCVSDRKQDHDHNSNNHDEEMCDINHEMQSCLYEWCKNTITLSNRVWN